MMLALDIYCTYDYDGSLLEKKPMPIELGARRHSWTNTNLVGTIVATWGSSR